CTGIVVCIACVEHGVQQLVLGLEVMQQSRRRKPGFPRDLGKARAAPTILRQAPLGDAENQLPPVLTLGEERVVSALHCPTPSCSLPNQPTEHTLGWFSRC